MSARKKLKAALDAAMLAFLPILMAEVLTGQEAHEWLGIAIFACFVAHHILNPAWIRGLFKGPYSPARCMTTILNLLLLADIVSLAVSGISMSMFVLPDVDMIRMSTARQLHLFASFWGLILMSMHLGAHAAGSVRRAREARGPALVALAFCAALACWGVYAFIAQRIWEYLFLITHFMMFDDARPVVLFFVDIVGIICLFAFISYYIQKALARLRPGKTAKSLAKILAFAAPVAVCVLVVAQLNARTPAASWEAQPAEASENAVASAVPETQEPTRETETETTRPAAAVVNDGMVYIAGGSFMMGSPDDEPWRVDDETLHEVTVSSFYLSPYETTQSEYEAAMGTNPSSFSGEDLPIENLTWLDAIAYCNARSEQEGLSPAYSISGDSVTWDRSADGYRLPTEAEWEYACRAGTDTPFNTEDSPGAEAANFYGYYPYQIEENYFSQDNLTTTPGEYRQTTVEVDSFSPNALGPYNMHGNVGEWVWDWYGEYDTAPQTDPSGPEDGVLRVYRGGGWNDFAKNMRSAYRATLAEDRGSFNIGLRLARNAAPGTGVVVSEDTGIRKETGGNVLIAFFSWGGNTRGIAEEIQAQTGADLFEIELEQPYSTVYNTVLEQAQHDQSIQASPRIRNHIEDFDQYSTILLGYPNWWASIPMPIASLLEEYDFSGKTIIPFCSHGGGRLGQSLTAIAKLAPDADMGEPLSVHYSGGADLGNDVAEWLETNGLG